MEKENILLWRRRRTEENIWREKNHFFGGKEKTEKEKEENVWRRKIFSVKKEENIWKRKIFFSEEKEKEENIWRRKISFVEEKNRRKKYLEKVFLWRRRKRRKLLGEGKYM